MNTATIVAGGIGVSILLIINKLFYKKSKNTGNQCKNWIIIVVKEIFLQQSN